MEVKYIHTKKRSIGKLQNTKISNLASLSPTAESLCLDHPINKDESCRPHPLGDLYYHDDAGRLLELSQD